ncbi:MAG TPA: cytochrome c1 [Gammaproteobacteria bacterium]|jgi:ubiquinol-cytochrome c reductase cytochrome c1 subunit|nr:cytochrome c1 [Gammaproteobacteria bacterium]
MRKIILSFLLVLLPALTLAAGGGVHLDKADIDLHNQQSLQRGAKVFVNYCLSCHSAQFQRYNRMARDIGLTDNQVIENLMFASDKVGSTMTVAMSRADGKTWFGAAPPDLSLTARSRGVDWLYTYLRTFYVDETRPFGVNNVVFPSVGMPHVLWELQGVQKAVYKKDEHGKDVIDRLEIVEPGKLTPVEYDQTVRDLVGFLSYVSEPVQLERKALGVKVILFLLVLLVVAYLLKKEYWKDVH